MAERKSETARSDDESRGAEPHRRSRSLGRRIATVLVVCGLAYLVGVGLISVIPQVFWPEAAELPTSLSCADGVRELRDELLSFASDHVARAGSDDSREMRPFFERWDLRHRALEARCEGEEADAWVQLGQTRERLEATLQRFDAEEGALARQVDHTLTRHGRGARNSR